MAEFPIMPVSVAYLLGDTMHFSNEELGAYVRILCALWLNGGILQESDLYKIAQVTRRKRGKILAQMYTKLTVIDGTVSQKRLTDTLLKVRANKRKAAEAGKVSWDPLRSHREHRSKQGSKQGPSKALIKKEDKKISTASSQSADEPQQAATDEASQTASRDVATESLVRSLQKRRHG